MRRIKSHGRAGFVAAFENEELRREETEQVENAEAAADVAGDPAAGEQPVVVDAADGAAPAGAEVEEVAPAEAEVAGAEGEAEGGEAAPETEAEAEVAEPAEAEVSDEVPENAILDDVGVGAETAETELMAISDDQNAQRAEQEELDEAAETAEALEAICIGLEAVAENGGLTPHGAQLVGLTLDHLYKRVGIPRAHMPALESFNGVANRAAATKIALEEAENNLAKIWEAIVEAVKKALNWLIDHFTMIFNAAARLKNRADVLAKRTGSMQGNPKQAKIDNERMVRALAIGGKIPNIAKESASLKSMTLDMLQSEAPRALAVVNALRQRDVKQAVRIFAHPTAVFHHIKFGQLSESAAQAYGHTKENVNIYRSQELMGGKSIIIHSPALNTEANDFDECAAALANFEIDIAVFDPSAMEPKVDGLPTLHQAEAAAAADAVSSIASEIRGFNKELSKVKQYLSEVTQVLQNASRISGSNGHREVSVGFRKLAAAAPKLLTHTGVKFAAYAMNTSKAMLDYVELSIKEYGAETEGVPAQAAA